jgi:hypothetical protein
MVPFVTDSGLVDGNQALHFDRMHDAAAPRVSFDAFHASPGNNGTAQGPTHVACRATG